MKDKNVIYGLLLLLALGFILWLISYQNGQGSLLEPFIDSEGVKIYPSLSNEMIAVTPVAPVAGADIPPAVGIFAPVTGADIPTNPPAVVVVPNQTTVRQSVPSICPPSYDNNGTVCVRQARTHPLSRILAICPAGYTNTGTACTRPSSTEASPSVLAACPPGYSNNGINCQNNADSYVKECSIAGGPIYPCREGFTDMGCYCERTAGVSTISLDTATCPPGYTRDGSRCYPRCNLDYVRQGETCVRPESYLTDQYMTCPPDYFRQGTNCFKACEPEFVVKGDQCESPASIKGVESMTCPPTYPELIGAKCYGPCPIGTAPLGTSCITRI